MNIDIKEKQVVIADLEDMELILMDSRTKTFMQFKIVDGDIMLKYCEKEYYTKDKELYENDNADDDVPGKDPDRMSIEFGEKDLLDTGKKKGHNVIGFRFSSQK